MVSRKAQHIWGSRQGAGDQDSDWSIAASYVSAFHEHVLPAVQSGKKAAPHVAEVCRALIRCNRETECDIVNCLETRL